MSLEDLPNAVPDDTGERLQTQGKVKLLLVMQT